MVGGFGLRGRGMRVAQANTQGVHGSVSGRGVEVGQEGRHVGVIGRGGRARGLVAPVGLAREGGDPVDARARVDMEMSVGTDGAAPTQAPA